MGLIDDKKNIFTTIGAYTSLIEEKKLPDTNNLFSSINNNDDINSFFLDVLNILVGTSALQDLTGELFTNLTSDIEPKIKNSQKRQLTNYNSGDKLPESFKNGRTIPVESIDVYGKLKTDPDSDTGALIYDKNQENFNNKVYEAIQNEGTDVTYNNLLIKYDSGSDSLRFKPTTSSQNDTIGSWFNDYIDNSNVFNKKEFISNVLNNIFGTISSSQNKTEDKLINELKIDSLLQKIINGEENLVINDDELNDITSKASELQNGIVYYDMGCGLTSAELPLSAMTNTISMISGSTDPFYVGNVINQTLDNGFSFSDNQETKDQNNETIKNGFFSRLIQFIQLELSKILTLSPEARMLIGLSSSFQDNGNVNIDDPIDDIPNFRVYINCIIKDILAAINEFIFNLIVTYLISLITPVIREIIREKINQYIGIIRSLISSKI